MSTLTEQNGWCACSITIAALSLALLAGCGKSDPVVTSPTSTGVLATATVGSGGGTVTHPDGVQVVIPVGALSSNTVIGIRSNPGGAPAPLQNGNAPAGPIYEFTPHDIVFNTPVTIRLPLPAGAVSNEVFMASLGEGWTVSNATANGAVAEVQRNSFSFINGGMICAVPAGNTDPYPCVYPSGGATLTATPSSAITQIASGWMNFGVGSAGSWGVNSPGVISVMMHYRAAPDCSDGGLAAPSGHVQLIRWNANGTRTTIFDQAVSMASVPATLPSGSYFSTGSGGSNLRGEGSTTVDVSSYLGDATNAFRFSFTCRRPGQITSSGGSDLVTILGPMAPPSGPFSIGGTVSGLTGTGLVLQNNGGDNLPVTTNGAFTFATPIPTGNPYSVTVQTQPTGQTCTVQNGTGTANGAVNTVTVTCPGAVIGNVAAISLGASHTCVRHTDGRVRCWGGQTFGGELGLGDASTRGDGPGEMGTNLPYVDLGTGRTAVQLQAGWFSTCAILNNSALKCWGFNSRGSLGLGYPSGTRIGDAPGEMGDNLPAVNLGTGRTAVKAAVDGSYGCAILDNGGVKCWGLNDTGLLGRGSAPQFGTESAIGDDPAEMGDNLPPLALGSGRTALDIDIDGSGHGCALLDNQSFKCWGRNLDGELGLGDTNARGDQPNEMGDNLPAVNVGTGRTVTRFGTGSGFTCALLDNGSVKCWGTNTFGQLGLGDTVPRGGGAGQMGDNLQAVNLGTGRTAVAIAVAENSTCVILDNSGVKCWGENSSGTLGLGDTNHRGDGANEMGNNLPALNLGAGRTATAIYANVGKVCAKLDTGAVKCWGENSSGSLGLGDTNNRGDGPNEMGDNLPVVDLTQ